MMIDAEPLKPYLAAVAKAREDWESVGAAYDAAPAESWRLSYAPR